MATKNTIQVFLLENKSIQTKINGYPYSYEGSYNIVAGDVNATEFEIASVPTRYADFTISVAMKNARGQEVAAPQIVNNKFTLPIGMAVAGYGQMVFSAHGTDEDGEAVTANFLPLKIKVSNTDANYTSGVINGTITIAGVVTLPPDSDAYAINTGTSTDAVITLGIPEGKGFVIDKTYSSIAEMNAGYATDGVRLYGFVLIDTGNVDDEDNAKLFIKTETEYKYLTDLSGAQGIKGETGDQGVGIANVTPNGTDENGGNKYIITLTNGQTADFVAPKGAKGDKGDTGNGISSNVITYATSTSGTTPPTSGWQSSIPTVAKGSYLWTRTVTNYTDGSTPTTTYTVAYQGQDGQGFDPQGNYPNATVGSATHAQNANALTNAHAIDGVSFNGSASITHFTQCATAAQTAAKTVTLTGFSLVNGAKICVKFTYANTVNSPTLNVNATGAKTIKADGDTTYVKWAAGSVMEFIYDGTYWVCVAGYPLKGMRVGYIYESFNDTTPVALYGGYWGVVSNGYLKATIVPSTELQAAGLPNITGMMTGINFLGEEYSDPRGSGAFTVSSEEHLYRASGTSKNSDSSRTVAFNAKNGGSDIYGRSTTVEPQHYNMCVWRRIS